MKNTKTRRITNTALTTILLLIIIAQTASAEITPTITHVDSDFCVPATIEIRATVTLTECEQLSSAKINIGNRQCNLPTSYGHYYSYGNCDLEVTVTETNPSTCYPTAGQISLVHQNLVAYTIKYSLTNDYCIGIYPVCLTVKNEVDTEATSECVNLIIDCKTTTTTTTTTTSTTTLAEREPPCGSYGDYDNDGYVTAEDYTDCFNQVGETYVQNCDVNGNGDLDFSDVTMIYDYVNGEINTFTVCTDTTTTTTTPVTTTTQKKRKEHWSDGQTYPVKPNKVIASCNDSIKNLGETDTDCGGENCPACDDGKHCLRSSDCKTQCVSGICQAPSCSDNYANQDETDVDCGGKTCDKCQNGEKCILNKDCISDNCDLGICRKTETCTVPTVNCSDSLRNQDETDVDCGGTTCMKCENYLKCSGDYDCQSNYCENHICKTPTCGDGIKNQNETETDCGGGACKPCETKTTSNIGVIGYVSALSGGLVNIFLVIIVLLLLGILGMYLTRKRKYVTAADYLESITDDSELEKFVNRNKPGITASTSRKIRRIKKFIDNGKIDIIWIKDWDYINELILKGLDDNSAESIALAKQMNSGLFIKNEEARKIAESEGIKVYSG